MADEEAVKKPNCVDRFFHISERGSSIRKEIIAGIVTFVCMCYVLPVNSSIMSDMGMSSSGVFMMTAILGCIVTLIMGLVANYPIVICAGMGLNAYLAYTVCQGQGFSWQETMILLTVAGIIFFVLSITPVRTKIIEAIPRALRNIIAASHGIFICIVGLVNSGIIISSGTSTLVELNTFLDPAMILGVVAIVVCFGLFFVKRKTIKAMAIPITIVGVVIIGVIISTIMIETGGIEEIEGTFHYTYQNLVDTPVNLPIWPWFDDAVSWADFSGIKEVFAYGVFSDSSSFGENGFGGALANIFTNPVSYIAIFSLVFVNLFDTTATMLSVGKDAGMIDHKGHLKNSQRAVLADATGALLCGPMGTSTMTSFAESGVGVSMGARTGLMAVSAAAMMLLSMFIYPIFSMFTAGCVIAPALVCVGGTIFVENVKNIHFREGVIGFTAFVSFIFTILSYSIATGIGMGLIVYCVMMLFSRRGKEVHVAIYVIAALFLVSFALDAIILIV
ncbi:MAG: NCS2 family permease [Coprobacillus sp.]|nr:NCS2 family permease [Coprobacillus sp.]